MSDRISHPAELDRTATDTFRKLVWFILLTGAAIRIYLLYSTHATEEDFYITLRYAENIAAGNGFVYNAGQHVLGTTTPLYTLVLACFARIGFDPTLSGKLLGIVADLMTGLLTYRLGRAVGRPVAGLAAAACLSFAPTNLIWSIKGMEVGIVAATVIGAWCAWVEKREVIAWVCAAVLVLLRIDGAVLAAIMLGATILRDRRIPWRGIAAFVVLAAPWTLFATLYFGSPLPLSLAAKLTVYGRVIPGRFPQLMPFLVLMLHSPFGLLIAAGCLVYGVYAFTLWRTSNTSVKAESEHPELGLAAPLLWIIVYYAGMALSHVVLFGWYFVPPTPIYYLVSMVGISAAVERLGFSEAAAVYKRVATGTAALVGLAVSLVAPHVARTLRESQAVETNLRTPIGIWIHDQARPADTLMLEPIGYIGYYSRLRVIDVIGLVSPEVLPSYKLEVACPDHDLWQRLRPVWLLLRAGQVTKLREYEASLAPEQRLGAAYDEVKSWKDPVNLAGAPAFVLYHLREDR